MTYSQKLRGLFPEISLHWEDLLLLEAFQIKYLPDRVAVKEFATLLRAYPVAHRFLVSKYPPITSFLTRILEENRPVGDKEGIEEQCQEALWEIGEINTITSLEGKVVADVGAGSGRIAFLVASFVHTVYAIEPIASFRSYMKEKAAKNSVDNLFVMDGTLDSIPLPNRFLDVLITSNAIGWNLNEELKEIERVIKPGGQAIHLLQSVVQIENPLHEILTSSPWNYTCLQDGDKEKTKLRYFNVPR